MLVRTAYTFSAYFSYEFSTLMKRSKTPSSNINANIIYYGLIHLNLFFMALFLRQQPSVYACQNRIYQFSDYFSYDFSTLMMQSNTSSSY